MSNHKNKTKKEVAKLPATMSIKGFESVTQSQPIMKVFRDFDEACRSFKYFLTNLIDQIESVEENNSSCLGAINSVHASKKTIPAKKNRIANAD